MRATNEWFRIYKIPDGKPENAFAFDGQAKNKAYALQVIDETFESWKRLISGAIPEKTDKYDIKVTNTSVEKSPHKVGTDHATYKAVPAAQKLAAQPLDPSGTLFCHENNILYHV